MTIDPCTNCTSTGLWKLPSYGKPRGSRAFPQDLENATRFPQLPQPLLAT